MAQGDDNYELAHDHVKKELQQIRSDLEALGADEKALFSAVHLLLGVLADGHQPHLTVIEAAEAPVDLATNVAISILQHLALWGEAAEMGPQQFVVRRPRPGEVVPVGTLRLVVEGASAREQYVSGAIDLPLGKAHPLKLEHFQRRVGGLPASLQKVGGWLTDANVIALIILVVGISIMYLAALDGRKSVLVFTLGALVIMRVAAMVVETGTLGIPQPRQVVAPLMTGFVTGQSISTFLELDSRLYTFPNVAAIDLACVALLVVVLLVVSVFVVTPRPRRLDLLNDLEKGAGHDCEGVRKDESKIESGEVQV